jgi:RNA polymerase sigma-70 factor (ECF subfamily)
VLAGSRRRRRREQLANARVCGRRLLDTDDIESLHERLDAERSARALHEALAVLGEGDRMLLEVIALEGLTPREAASALGVPRAALRMRLSRARSRVRRELAKAPDQLTRPLIRTEI